MKKLVDVMTVVLLIVAFAIAYHTGFVGKTSDGGPMLDTGMFCGISMAGVLILTAVGGITSFVTRRKNNLVPVWFIILLVAEICGAVAVCTALFMVWTGMFGLDSGAMRALYIIGVVLVIAGYVESLVFADALAKRDGDTEGDEGEWYGEEPEEEEEDEDEGGIIVDVPSKKEDKSGKKQNGSFMGF